MVGVIVALHLIVCVVLIIIVLVQRGRGGGLVESFSGLENMFGVKTNVFLTRTTTVFSIIFFITCLTLTYFSVRQSSSLMRGKIPVPVTQTVPVPVPEEAQKVPAQTVVPPVQPPAPAPVINKEPKFKKETPAAPVKKTEPVKGLRPVQEAVPQVLEGQVSQEKAAPSKQETKPAK